MNSDQVFTIFIILVISGLILWAGRELVCWYFKINERLNLLRDILKALDGEETKGKSTETYY